MILSGSTAGQAQADSASYFALLAANGVTLSAAEKLSLRQWAEELYSRVGRQDFITLRASQNMGTGAVAYTFQGRACALVNGPAWGANSMVFSNTSQDIATPWVINQPDAIMTVAKTPSFTNYFTPFDSEFSGRQALYIIYGVAMYAGAEAGVSTSIEVDRFFSAVGNFDGASSSIGYNGAILGSGLNAGTSATNPLRIGQNNIHSSQVGEVTLVLPILRTITAGEYAALNAAYKATIGQGLGLP